MIHFNVEAHKKIIKTIIMVINNKKIFSDIELFTFMKNN